MSTRNEADARQIAMASGRTHWRDCWRDHNDCMDRRIDERIAAALERVATRFDEDVNWHPMFRDVLREVAAELRAAKPASEPATHDSGWHHTTMRDADKPAPPPSLVEWLRKQARMDLDAPYRDRLLEAADALEAAQAVNVAAEKVVESLKRARNLDDWTAVPHQIDALAATMESKP